MTGDVIATVIQDTNGNGVANSGEPGLPGWTIFVDLDRNGVKRCVGAVGGHQR